MLRQLRNKETAKKILIGLAAVIIPAFVLWGAGSATRQRRGPSFAGTIFGKKVSFDEYGQSWRAVKNEALMKYDNFDEIYKELDLEGEAWIRMILLREAERYKIKASDEEVRQAIGSLPFFVRNNRFDMMLYEQGITNSLRVTPREFEEDIRGSIKIAKLANIVTEDIRASQEEILESYKEENEKIKIAYALLPVEDFSQDISVSEEDIESYYNANAETFRLPERVDVEFIEFKYGDYTGEIDIDEDELLYYYESRLEEFEHPETVRASHILFEDEKKAKNVLKKLKKRRRRRKDYFAETAEKYSKCPSKDRGGDLGYFERGKMAPEFEEAAFALETGEISEIIKTDFGYHIIMLEDKKEAYTDKFEDVKESIKEGLLAENAKNEAYDEAGLALSSIEEASDFEKTAGEYGKTIKRTGYFARGGVIEGIGWNPEMERVAFGLRPNEVGPLISQRGAASEANYIIRLAGRKKPEIPPLEDVKESIKTKVKQAKGLKITAEKMREKRETVMEEVSSGLSFEEAASEAGLESKNTDYITRMDYIKDIGPASNIKEVFDYKPGDISPVLKMPRAACLVTLLDYIPIEEEKFLEEKEAMGGNLTELKKRRFLSGWLDELKSRAGLRVNF